MSTSCSPPSFEIPRTLDELRNAGLIRVGSVVQHVSARVIPLHAINHSVVFQSLGNRLRIIRIPVPGQVAASDADSSLNLDSKRRAVSGIVPNSGDPAHKFIVIP